MTQAEERVMRRLRLRIRDLKVEAYEANHTADYKTRQLQHAEREVENLRDENVKLSQALGLATAGLRT